MEWEEAGGDLSGQVERLGEWLAEKTDTQSGGKGTAIGSIA